MKKIISAILILVLLLSVCGCNNADTTSDNNIPTDNIIEEDNTIEETYKDIEKSLYYKNPVSREGRITDVTCLTEMLRANKKIEIEIHISDIKGNVFNPEEVDVEIELKGSDGEIIKTPGFFYQAHGWTEEGRVGLPLEGTESFRFRVVAKKAGSYDYKITFKENGKEADSVSGYMNIYEANDDRGIIGVSKENPNYFAFENGEGYIPIGHNVCWNSETASSYNYIYYDNIFKQMSANGANYSRLWLAVWDMMLWSSGGKTNDFSENLYKAAALDRMMESCAENEIYISFTIFNHCQFKSKGTDNSWGSMPFKLGKKYGYLESPAEFWTNEQAKKDAKCLIRYLVARYGYSRNILTWELCNEITSCEGENTDIRQWCAEMTEYIRSIDSTGHMISVSSAKYDDPINFDKIFDFVNIHWYAYNSIEQYTSKLASYSVMYNKPVLASEMGVSWEENIVNETILHQQIWSCAMGLTAGASASWYWQEIDEIPDGAAYKQYKPLADYMKRIDLSNKKYFSVSSANIGISNNQIKALGYRSDDSAYIWIYDSKYNYLSTSFDNQESSKIKVKLEEGNYTVEWINPWTGESLSKEDVTHSKGVLEITVPAWSKDIAVAIEKKQ